MLSRRHLRIKVLQAVYAFVQSGSTDLAKGEKQLLSSIEKISELIIYQLSFLIEMRDFAHNRIEESKKKFFPSDEDLNPNMRFVENKVLMKIEENRDYKRNRDRLRINWGEEREMIRKGYIMLRESKFFEKYMHKGENGFEEDRDLLIKLVKKVLADFELLEYFYESKSVFWAFDSYFTGNQMLIKYLKSIDAGDDELRKIPPVIKNNEGDEDRAFMIRLFHKTILSSEKFGSLIEEKARNWELDRIALMDTILIKMALAELLEFPSIPVKVTLNEYIDISKYYSSAKSKVFINGILDKLIVDLKEQDMIKKTGRGLLEY
ncbi:MAG: transcription antitermination factor NusB [Bacteroidales bacterium]|nr:transcription antitermination factor NusB [Bacteroidales bacterium]